MFNTYGYYENTAGEWFLGVTTEFITYYSDYTGYTFEDLQEEVTKAEDTYAHYWKSMNGNGEIMYTKVDDYA